MPEGFPVGQGDIGLVPGDGVLDSPDQQRRLGADGQVHGLCGYTGLPGDLGDRGARPTPLGERFGRCLQYPLARLGGLLGTDGGVVSPLDLSHELSVYQHN